MNPLQVTELREPDVMGLHRVRQDASIDLITDCGIVIGKADSMLRIILDHLEVNDFEQNRNAGIESDVHEHAETMDGDDLASHLATPRQGRLKLLSFVKVEWVLRQSDPTS
jgi:hypothetical protein